MDKKQILQRMRMFSERTVANGCSEAEAMIAAQKLSELQSKYNLTLTELDIDELSFEAESVSLGNKVRHPVYCALYGLQEFCGVKLVMTGARLEIFGEPHKIDNARYMIELIKLTMDAEYARYKASWEYEDAKMRYHPRRIRADFMNAMGYRISKRLLDMAKQERSEAQSQAATGTSLVVLANQKLVAAFKKRHPRLGSGSGRSTSNSSATSAGRAAGDRAGLNRGVGSGSNGGTLRLSE